MTQSRRTGLESFFRHSCDSFWYQDILPEPLLLQELQGTECWAGIADKHMSAFMCCMEIRHTSDSAPNTAKHRDSS